MRRKVKRIKIYMNPFATGINLFLATSCLKLEYDEKKSLLKRVKRGFSLVENGNIAFSSPGLAVI